MPKIPPFWIKTVLSKTVCLKKVVSLNIFYCIRFRLYINFCDPWPKSNQKKRRLTHGNFLKKYRQVLAEGGQIHFKTDNDKLFEWSLEEIPQFGFTLSEVTRDLHADGPVGVMTDYERKFYGEGKSINRCVATMVEWTEPEIEDVPSPAE